MSSHFHSCEHRLGHVGAGVFAAPALGELGDGSGPYSMVGQLTAQLIRVGITLVWSGAMTFVILKGVDAAIGLRVDEADEETGLDLAQHGETGYNLS